MQEYWTAKRDPERNTIRRAVEPSKQLCSGTSSRQRRPLSRSMMTASGVPSRNHACGSDGSLRASAERFDQPVSAPLLSRRFSFGPHSDPLRPRRTAGTCLKPAGRGSRGDLAGYPRYRPLGCQAGSGLGAARGLLLHKRLPPGRFHPSETRASCAYVLSRKIKLVGKYVRLPEVCQAMNGKKVTSGSGEVSSPFLPATLAESLNPQKFLQSLQSTFRYRKQSQGGAFP